MGRGGEKEGKKKRGRNYYISHPEKGRNLPVPVPRGGGDVGGWGCPWRQWKMLGQVLSVARPPKAGQVPHPPCPLLPKAKVCSARTCSLPPASALRLSGLRTVRGWGTAHSLNPTTSWRGTGAAGAEESRLQPSPPADFIFFSFFSVSLGLVLAGGREVALLLFPLFLFSFLMGQRGFSLLSRGCFYFRWGKRKASRVHPPLKQYFSHHMPKKKPQKKPKSSQGAQSSLSSPPQPCPGKPPHTRAHKTFRHYLTLSLGQYLSCGLCRATPLFLFC